MLQVKDTKWNIVGTENYYQGTYVKETQENHNNQHRDVNQDTIQ